MISKGSWALSPPDKLGAQVFGRAKQAADVPEAERPAVRNDLNLVLAELTAVGRSGRARQQGRQGLRPSSIHEAPDGLGSQYAPWWVRVLSALLPRRTGTMIGYQAHRALPLASASVSSTLAPAQGAAAELVAAALIGGAGFSGYPVSTTHVVTGGITGTMVGSGAGIQPSTLWQIGTAWLLTLPATILISGGLFYILS